MAFRLPSTNRLGWPLLALALAVGACAGSLRRQTFTAGDRAALANELKNLVERQMREHQVAGLGLAIVTGRAPVLEIGYGWEDREAGLRAGGDTRFCVGSVTKLFTASALMQLVEARRADLDRPLADYLPEFRMRSRFPAAPLTLRSILSHHAGLPADRFSGAFGAPPGRFQDLPALLHDDYQTAPPWTIVSYSNLGYSLLGTVIERVAGEPYAARVASGLLGPLGMARSNFEPTLPLCARPYEEDRPVVEPRLRDLPAGGLYSSAHDLGCFMRMVLGGGALDGKRIMATETLEAMLRPQNTAVPLDLDERVGLGWFFIPGPGRTRIGHDGATIHFASSLLIEPTTGLGVAVLANSGRARAITRLIAEQALELAAEAGMADRDATLSAMMSGPESALPAVPLAAQPASGTRGEEVPNRPVPPSSPRQEAGVYSTELGMVALEPRRDGLRFEISGLAGNLAPLPDGSYRIQILLLGFLPLEPELTRHVTADFAEVQGHRVLIARLHGQAINFGERIAPGPIPAAWRARRGRYAIADPGDDFPLFQGFELAEDHGFLVLRREPAVVSLRSSLPLLALGDREAIVAGMGSGRGDTLRAERGPRGDALIYSGYRLARIP